MEQFHRLVSVQTVRLRVSLELCDLDAYAIVLLSFRHHRGPKTIDIRPQRSRKWVRLVTQEMRNQPHESIAPRCWYSRPTQGHEQERKQVAVHRVWSTVRVVFPCCARLDIPSLRAVQNNM